MQLPLNVIQPNPVQPRTMFLPDKINELAQSIRVHGVLQPLIVRRNGDAYQLVAGERRWRAAKLAELAEVPVIVQDVADNELLELALIENIQREDLNPIEAAQAYERLIRELGLTQDELARRTGKDRTSITNTLRLLKLPTEVQILLVEHRISMGHARAILGIPDPDLQVQTAEKAAAQGLSVRQVEKIVRQLTDTTPERAAKRERKADANVKAATEELERVLGTRVRIVEVSEQRGRIEIEYYSQDDLDRIYTLIVGDGAGGRN
ncbi:MAG: ParB/RepB/Spo0J family partition protein [Bryobacteraceae bacterium]|nr:ParB/RepB/Spo0J family partition protein [Bryobacteraceae bacterium]